ncbi:Uu.00g037010.m01.CDS01 [Anthostomella pinea]|uniref:Uu.00g037010.m01.CDS01 n=1 Tax=Anthostomella pinea TaxID=933095 RepID=A0AAI8V9N2_9PEZI|nr:Uu.00g037010.m01.CDS01 [Anthostomella pinea]
MSESEPSNDSARTAHHPHVPHMAHGLPSNGVNGVNGVNDEKNVEQVSDDHPPPDDVGKDARSDGADGADGAHSADEKDSSQPHRSSTLKDKFKDRKQKIKTKAKAKPSGGYDSTPIPDAPPGYTVKFTFHRAENLPVADFGKGASDPFLTATLATSMPKRHKEDPDLVYRTRTIKRSLEPHWEEEWLVANVPSSGFRIKCRLYDEDSPDSDDRLGNVTVLVHQVSEDWEGFAPPHNEFEVKKRVGSKRAYLLKACTSAWSRDVSMTPRLYMSAQVVGKSDPPHGQMYTVGPSYYFKHYSPMIGRMTGVRVNREEAEDSNEHQSRPSSNNHDSQANNRTQKYDFQANEIQLCGPVPPKLYHRYVEFKPIIGLLFRDAGFRGRLLNKALHHQHRRVYNFDSSTEWGTVKPCSEEASIHFLKMAHFDEGGRIFTYVITLDGLMRFTETGKEFGIDLLSKHTMHSDANIYVACAGEFFIRRLKKPEASGDPEPDLPTHPDQPIEGGPPKEPPPTKPEYYQLIIDNDSGTYRPDKSVLPDLRALLERNFPGLGVVTLACDDPEDEKLKAAQQKAKKKEGRTVHMVANRSPSASSFSSDDVSDLEDMEQGGDAGRQSKRERLVDLLEEPRRIRERRKSAVGSNPSNGPNGSSPADP